MSPSAAEPIVIPALTPSTAAAPRLSRLRRGVVFAAVCVLASAANGCGVSPELRHSGHTAGPHPGTCGTPQPQPQAEPPESSAGRSHVGALLTASLNDVDLRSDQRARALAMIRDLDARTTPSRIERRQIIATLADDVAAGTLRRASIEARLSAIAKTDDATAAALDHAANSLYAELDARQRSRFLKALRTNWRHAGPEGLSGYGRNKQQMRELLRDLDLTRDQKHALRAKVKGEIKGAIPALREQRQAIKERAREAADAFRSDRFNATTLGIGKESLAARRSILAVKLRVVDAALPSLTSAQRLTLAEYIRSQGASID